MIHRTRQTYDDTSRACTIMYYLVRFTVFRRRCRAFFLCVQPARERRPGRVRNGRAVLTQY